MAQPHRLPPFTPFLQRGRPIARKLKHAVLFWERGFRTGTDNVGKDSRTGRLGFTAAGTSYQYNLTIDSGRVIDHASGSAEITWSDIGSQWNTSRGMTYFVLLRPDATTQSGLVAFYRRKNTATTDTGWKLDFDGAAPSHYVGRVADGASTAVAISTTTALTTRTDAVCVRADPDRGFVSIWVNGVKEAQSALAFAPGNPALPLSMIQAAVAKFSVVAFWNRPLADAEIRSLYADPFQLWRQPRREFFMDIGKAVGSTYRNGLWLSM